MSKTVRRLYEQFRPEQYSLQLVPDKTTMTFTGEVVITGQKVGRPSKRVTFHQAGLRVTRATITKHDKKGDETTAVLRINAQKSFEEVRLHAETMLYPGRYSITMAFSGTITRPMDGMYPCFFDYEGQEQVIIATQFESHFARQVFPCIDEPEAKATFDLSLETPVGETVIANTPIKTQTVTKNKLVTVFETTPKMSTYLLAFVYGNIACLESKTKDGVVVRTFATPDNVQHTQFALDVAVRCLEFYNEYYAIPYPLEKCDLIALPDFASGAMENWGCMTFREQTLVVDDKNTSLPIKQYVAMVVAHELAHQWFGNLVTMRWWTDLWLNEGFASWMEYLAVDHLFPEWHIWTEFMVSEQEPGMRLDALENTHPIEVPIHHPDEIRTIFDTISYSKGSSVLHMLHAYLGADDFREGLRHYLKTHAYGNTDTVDLWAAFETVSGKQVQQFMHAWTAQAGFPVLRATLEAERLTLQQERFYLNPATPKLETRWPIPLQATVPLSSDIALKPSQVVTLTAPASDLILNHEHTGFYRTVYDSKHLADLARLVSSNRLDIRDRMSLLSDALETAKAGYSSSVDALQLLRAYSSEDNTFVWDIIAGGLGTIRTVMNDEPIREAMKPFSRQLIAAQLQRLGWKAKANESHFDTLLRPTILGIASIAEEPSVVTEALRQFRAMRKPEDLAPDLRGVIYGTAARTGGETEFTKLLALHNASKNGEERVTLSGALTGFQQPEFIDRALAQIDSATVRLQDASYWIAYSFMNRYARNKTWEWLTSHWQWLETNLGSDLAFPRLPMYVARSYSDTAFLETYTAFFDQHRTPTLTRAINQGIETIEWQAAWRKRDLDGIRHFFVS